MSRKLFRSGNSTVVSIPPAVLKAAGLHEGDEVTIVADVDQQRIIITPVTRDLPEVRDDLLGEVDRFIQRYRPALKKLAAE